MGVVLVVVMLWAFLTRTITGKAMLATAANRLAARPSASTPRPSLVVVHDLGGDRAFLAHHRRADH
jgi:ribose/xylose/arabinose/galactoside ABC-type transport system permease subunit